MALIVIPDAGRFVYHDGYNLEEVAAALKLTIADDVPNPNDLGATGRALIKPAVGDDQQASVVAIPPGSPQWIGYFPAGVQVDGATQYIVWTHDEDGRPAGYTVLAESA